MTKKVIGNPKAMKSLKTTKKELNEKKDVENEIEVRMKKTRSAHKTKRAFSEIKVLDILDNETLEEGECLHFISGGDVDSFSYVKAISRKTKINYLSISTWCIGRQDILDIEEMLKNKKIAKIDIYGGEILPRTYPTEFKLLRDVVEKYNGRVCIFCNHSKVYVGKGEKFDFVIESSANVNTNPRTEQTTITISSELADFYKEFYDGIKSFV